MDQILHSQFFVGGFLLMISGAVMALLKEMPDRIAQWIKSQFSVNLVILDSDPLFESMLAWLDAQPYSKRTRRLAVSTSFDDDDKDEKRVLFSPAPGDHLLRYRGKFIWINRERSKPEGAGAQTRRPIESITLTVIGRSQAPLRTILKDASATVIERQRERVAVYVGDYGWWRKLKGTRKRPYDSVFLPDGDAEALIGDARWFLRNRESYYAACVPYRRGYLLHGKPGTGKTSIVAALASELNLSLYVLPLSSPGMSDQQLSSLLLAVRPGSIVLLEDVDAVGLRRQAKQPTQPTDSCTTTPTAEDQSGVTLSGLLNCLDGIVSQEGCLTFLTTNDLAALDEALIRPGRVDMRLEFKQATEHQIVSAYQRFFPNSNGDAEDFARQFADGDVVMAKVQEELMRLRFRPQD